MVLTHDEMLRMWMIHRYHEMPRSDLAMARADGVDMTQIARDEMNAWYLKLLDEADPTLVDTVDIAPLLEFVTLADGSAEASLPDGCRKLTYLRMSGCDTPAAITDSGSVLALRQFNRFTRGSVNTPVAVTDNRCVRVFSPPAQPYATEARATMIPTDGCYRFSERALATIEPFGP